MKTTSAAARKRFLEMARQIAEGEKDYISPEYGDSPITASDYDILTEFAGGVICFDDDYDMRPTADTHHERVMFLCLAAEAA